MELLNIGQTILKYESDIIYHIGQLIRIRSVAGDAKPGMPYGEGIHRALTYMLELGESLGFRSANVDGYAGHVEYGSGAEMAAVLVHLDTVPEGSGWSCDPFGGEMRDGCIFGRGAADDKGPAVVALYALKAVLDAGVVPARRIRIIFGTNEENGMTDMDEYFAREPLPDYAFTPDAGYPITNAEKGYYVVKLKQRSDAVLHEADLQQQAGRLVGGRQSAGGGNGVQRQAEGDGNGLQHQAEGSWSGWLADSGNRPGFAAVRLLEGGTAPNVVPDCCRAVLDMQGWDAADVARIMQAAEEHKRLEAEIVAGNRLELRATGKSGHGAYPPSGINAIAHMLDFLNGIADDNGPKHAGLLHMLHDRIGFEAFGESLGIAVSDETHGRTTVNLAQINVDGNGREAVLNVRHPVTADGPALIETIRRTALQYGVEAEVTAHLAPLFIPPEHPLIRMLSRAYETVTGEKAGLLSIGGGTYARKLQNRGVAFGAGIGGTDTRVHQPDEFVRIEDMMKHGQICAQAIYELIRAH